MKKAPDRFQDFAGEAQPGILAELFDFLKHNKKWWLLPILLIISLFGLLMALAGSGARRSSTRCSDRAAHFRPSALGS